MQVFKVQEKGDFNPFVKSLMVGLFAAFLILPFQGSRGLWEPDEGRYTCIASQMLRTGDFVNPSYNNKVLHFAKPPLTYWAIVGGIALFGRNEWGARLANVLAFVATVVVVYWMGKIYTPSRPWLPPLIYATFPLPFVAANIVTTDTLLTLWEGVAVLGFVRWWASEDRSRENLLLMWGGFGMAFLTKGPPGLLPLLSILFFVSLAGGLRSASRLAFSKGLLMFAAVGLGWYVVVTATDPDLLHYFINDELINRIGTKAHNRNPEWYKPFIIYLPILLGGTLPYTYFLLRAIPSMLRTLLPRKGWRNSLARDWRVSFPFFWFFLPFVIFCVSYSRQPLYILPLFMPLALVAGRLLEHRRPGRLSVCLLIAWILCLLVAKWGVAHYDPMQRDSRPIARAIASTIDPTPNEVLFVDTRPFWGVSLYLGCEVEAAKWGNSSPETLNNKLAHLGSGTLLVVLKSDAKRVLTILHDLGYGASILGEFQRWVFITPGTETDDLPIKADHRIAQKPSSR